MNIRRKYIRDLASRLLLETDMRQPPVRVEEIARHQGVTVQKRSVQAKVSGFLYRNSANGKAVIGVNRAQHPNRQRFTIAHELGHLLLHSGDDVHVDIAFTIKLRDQRSSTGTDTEEMESNLFAAELLMPIHFLREDLKRLGDLDVLDEQVVTKLANAYRVSSQAMAVRLSHLGYLHV
jgi:Zn-dependent peptidase ImmA (M78 family)